MKKGATTHLKLLDSAMDYVCRYGLLSMSIGEIAKQLNMSRTGIISHFRHKQDMQIAVLRHCEDVFVQEVLKPNEHEDALIYLTQWMRHWPSWVLRVRGQPLMSCPFVKAVAEYQERDPCPVREVIVDQQRRTLALIEQLVEQAMAQGSLHHRVEPSQLAYVLYSLYLGHNISKHLLHDEQADQRHWHQVQYHLHRAQAKETS